MVKFSCAPKQTGVAFKEGTNKKERKKKMFGKDKEISENFKQGDRNALLIENLMKFVGAKNIEELEAIVTSAESRAEEDESRQNDMLFNAVSDVKNKHSILEAKEMEKSEDFVNAVLAGFEPDKAYMLANMERLINEAYEKGMAEGKNSILNKTDRIDEEGVSISAGYKAEIDPRNMTFAELKKIKERLKKGENIRI